MTKKGEFSKTHLQNPSNKQALRRVMGKAEKKKKGEEGYASYQASVKTLREESRLVNSSIGRSHSESNPVTNKTVAHLQSLACWSAHIPELAALYGNRLASNCEAAGVRPPPSNFFSCDRCETILQPGFNCSVRVRTRPKNARHKPRAFSKSSNIVVYTCKFCLHENIKPGASKKKIKKKDSKDPKDSGIVNTVSERVNKKLLTSSSSILGNSPRNPVTEGQSGNGKKRKRKGWSSLKDLSNSNNKQPSFSNLNALKIPSFKL